MLLDALLDSDAFNDRLFSPRADRSRCDSARDVDIDVPSPAASTLSSSAAGTARLHLRVHAVPTARVRVLLFHGNGEVVADYDGLAESFARCGAALAVVDFRGYGASTGVPSLRAIVDDALHVVRACPAELPVVVMGRSLGSLCAAEVCGSAANVRAIVLDSAIARLGAFIERRGISVPPVLTASRFDPLPKVRSSTRPLLVLHGEEDRVIDVSEGRALFEASPADIKSFACLADRGHNDLFLSPGY